MSDAEVLLRDFEKRLENLRDWISSRDYVGPNRIFQKGNLSINIYNHGTFLSWKASKGPHIPLKPAEGMSGLGDTPPPQKCFEYTIKMENDKCVASLDNPYTPKIKDSVEQTFKKLLEKTLSL